MTRRSIAWGLLAVVALSAAAFFNDLILKGTYLVGHFLPIAVFGVLAVFVLIARPLWRRFAGRPSLSGAELAVILAIALFGCYVPGRGLMHQFTAFLMLPFHHERTTPGWQGGSPRLSDDDLADPAGLVAALRGEGAAATPAARRLRDALPADVRGALDGGPLADPAAEDRRVADLLAALNGLLGDPGLAAELPTDALALSPATRPLLARDRATLSPVETARLNRGLIEAALPGAFHPRRVGVLERVPPRMLADPSGNPTVALDGFVTGLARGDRPLSPRAVPWSAWTRTLAFWFPVVLAFAAACIGLSLVLHRQWSSHELLPYPTVQFARAILPGPDGGAPPTLRSRWFWVGAGFVVAVHTLNYLNRWWPEYVIPVRLQPDLTPLMEIFPVFKRAAAWSVFKPTLAFTAIGIAYLLATDVSLSLGVAPYVYYIAVGTAAGYGLSFGSGHLKPTIDSFLYAGGYAAMFLTILHSGRHYYRLTFARALGLRPRDGIEPHAVWGARLFLAAMAVFVALLAAVGVDVQLAALYAVLAILIVTVMSRLLAEAGVYFIHAYFFPCAVIAGFMGSIAAGQQQILLMGMVSSVLLIDQREMLMPFVTSALQLADGARARLRATAGWGFAAIVIGLLIAIPTALYWQYRLGAMQAGDWWCTQGVPRFAFDLSTQIGRNLEAQGSEDLSAALSGWARFGHVAAQPSLLVAFFTTFGLVLLFAFLRRRFARWPLHPLLFLVLGTWQSRALGFSFLVGWAIKKIVMKYGGAAVYQSAKPLMIGLIAGEVLASIVPLVTGLVYYWITGKPPIPFSVLGA